VTASLSEALPLSGLSMVFDVLGSKTIFMHAISGLERRIQVWRLS
jgi:hypothetical protein